MKIRMKATENRILSVITALVLIAGIFPAAIYRAAGGNAAVVNGGFENGTAGFENVNASLFEVIAEPGNTSNHVLHVKGAGKYKQTVAVEKNTDYIWTLRMKKLDDQQSVYFDAIAEDGVTNLITAVYSPSSGAYTNLYNGRAAVDINKGLWGIFTVRFNSGDNTSVAITGDMWAANREYYTDDWAIEVVPEAGELENGDFENGTSGYKNINASLFEVIAEPGNTSNHVLHVKGAGKFQQTIAVDKNTDYIWTLPMKKLDDQQSVYFDVIAEDYKTNLITSVTSSSAGAYTNLYNGRAAVDINKDLWGTFVIKFNSGNNTSVALTGDMWAANREYYTDDWSITEEIKIGAIVNGSFDNGTKGFTNIDAATFEAVAEPGNTSNKVLHLIGGGSYYQQVPVAENTDYVWTFKMKDLGAVGSTRIYVSPEGSSDNLITEISQSGGGYASVNDGTYASAATYNKAWVTFTVKFNSGDNESIRLLHNTWAANREIYMDDWTFAKPRVVGEILNGSFDEGTKYYDNQNTVVFEAIADPQDSGNNILHAGDGGKFSQTVLVAPNTDYVWSFKMRSLDSAGNIYADVVQTDNTDITGSVSHIGATYAQMYNGRAAINAGGNWATFSVRFNSGANTEVKLQIDTWAAGRNRYFDDWKLKIAAPAGEMLNGDFESGELSAYDCDSYTTAVFTDEIVHGGSGAAIVTKNDTDGSGFFYQSISVEKNTDYIWRFWARFNNINTPVGTTVRKTGGSGLPSRINGDRDTDIEPSPGFDFHRIRYNDAEWHEYKVFFSTGDNQTVDLALLLYKAESELITDDWSIEKVGTTDTGDTLIDVGFEDENMGCHEVTKPCWTVTEEEAHSGKKSIKYDGSTSAGPTSLMYLDEYGVIADTVGVEANTKYRFSFWYKGKGDRLDMANVTFKLYSGGSTYHTTGIYTNKDTEWKYAEQIFDSGDKKGFRLLLNGMILGSRKFSVYVDDIKLEKITVGVNDTEISPAEVVCGKDENLIPAGSLALMSSGYEKIQKLTLTPYGVYNFKATYTAAGANGKIGIAADTDGTPFTDGKSIISVTDTNGQSVSSAFTFTAPESGIVYLVTSNTAGSINITDLVLYAVNPTPETPVDKVELKNPTKSDTASIWDQDFEFDFDWNNEDTDTEITEPDEAPDEPEVTPTAKKYQRIKKRKLISSGSKGISGTAVALICVGGGVLIAAAAAIAVIIIRRKKGVTSKKKGKQI